MGLAVIIPGADYSAVNIGTVTPSDTIELISLAIAGPDTVNYQAQYSAIYNPADTTQTRVGWSVDSGSAYASVDAFGKVTTKSGADGDSVTIRVYSLVNPQIFATKTISVTHHYVYDFTELLQTNQSVYNHGALATNPIDGKTYPYFKADTPGIVGQPFSSGLTQNTLGCYQIFRIPLHNFASIKVPVLKSTSGMGFAFANGQDNVVSAYLNTTTNTGTYVTIPIPSGSDALFLVLTKSIYDAVGETMYAELIDA